MHPLDQTLQERLPHLQIHPNYLPYIGKNYATAKQKVMLIAESHYVDKKFDGQITADFWHSFPEQVYALLEKHQKGADRWFNTRSVVNYYLEQKKQGKHPKGLSIFKNMEQAYHEVESDVELMEQCIYFNYFQRPAEYTGASILFTPADAIQAQATVLTYIELFQPNKVLFVSNLAYENFIYQLNRNPIEGLPFIGNVPHPSSAWWNKSSPKYGSKEQPIASGRDKFIRLLRIKGGKSG